MRIYNFAHFRDSELNSYQSGCTNIFAQMKVNKSSLIYTFNIVYGVASFAFIYLPKTQHVQHMAIWFSLSHIFWCVSLHTAVLKKNWNFLTKIFSWGNFVWKRRILLLLYSKFYLWPCIKYRYTDNINYVRK